MKTSIFILLLLFGCSDEPPLEICVKGHNELILKLIPHYNNGKIQTILIPTSEFVCDKYDLNPAHDEWAKKQGDKIEKQ